MYFSLCDPVVLISYLISVLLDVHVDRKLATPIQQERSSISTQSNVPSLVISLACWRLPNTIKWDLRELLKSVRTLEQK